ncbi:MAG: hypothetical protein ABSF69_06905 [Polyangiaceae bacterium]|jgi:hypothetical protein
MMLFHRFKHLEFAPFRRMLGAASWVALMALTTAAWAKGKSVAVYVEGPGAPDVREALVDAVPKGPSVADADSFSQALSAQGQKGPFAKKLDGKGKPHEAAVERIRAAATALGLDAVLVARVSKVKAKRRIRLLVVDASGGEQGLDDVVLDGDSDPRHDSALTGAVGDAFEKYKGAPAPEAKETKASKETKETKEASGEEAEAPADKAAAEASPAAEESKDTIAHRPRGLISRSLFDVDIGGVAAGRSFDFNDGVSTQAGPLRSYSVAPAALFSGNVEFFPLADQSGYLRDIGLIGSFSRSLFLDSSAAGGLKISTVETAAAGGLRFRIHPWGDTATIIGVSDSYTMQSVTFAATGTAIDTQVPAVDYRSNRTAVDVRVPFGSFALLGGAGFRAVFAAGGVADRFQDPSVDGVDAELGLAFRFAQGWEARINTDYERYFYSFKPILMPLSTYIAGGAVDQFFGGGLALAYIF